MFSYLPRRNRSCYSTSKEWEGKRNETKTDNDDRHAGNGRVPDATGNRYYNNGYNAYPYSRSTGRVNGYYDRWGNFHQQGYYDRWGNYHPY